MKCAKKIVAGYELLNELKRAERNASDHMGIKDINTLNMAIGSLEDSLFYVESILNTPCTLNDHSEISGRYMQELKEIQKECTTPIDKQHIQEAISEAEESAYHIECIKQEYIYKNSKEK